MAVEETYTSNTSITKHTPNRWLEFWGVFSQNKGAVAGLTAITTIILITLFANVIAPYDPAKQFRGSEAEAPGQRHVPLTATDADEGSAFLLGTDSVGRDVLSRIIYGGRYSLYISAIVTIISLIIGVGIGLLAGMVGGVLETGIMRFMDVVLSFPTILLALVIVASLGPGLENAMIAISIIFIPGFVRLTRAQVISEKNKEYVMASYVLGASRSRIAVLEILPNCMAPLIVQATLNFSTAILDIAALGFLGLGAQPPLSEWGTMLSEAKEYITSYWWMATFPGLAILISVLSINLVGEGLRDALDPKMRKA